MTAGRSHGKGDALVSDQPEKPHQVRFLENPPQQLPERRHQVTVLELGDPEHGLAEFLGVAMNVGLEVHERHCLADMRAGFEAHLRMGLRLMAMKQACKHGEFERRVADLGISSETAQRRMRLVKAICSEGDARRRQALIEMGQSKALGLLAASPIVRDQLLQDAGLLREALDGTKREFEQRIRELERKAGNLNAELVISKGSVDGLQARLLRIERAEREDKLPPMVAALRAELLVLQKKAELALDGVRAVGVDLVGLAGDQVANPWADGTLRLAVAGLASIGLQLQGVLNQYLKAAPEVEAQLPAMAYLSPQEMAELQRRFIMVAGAEALEKEQRRVDAINAEKDSNRARGARLKRPDAKGQRQ